VHVPGELRRDGKAETGPAVLPARRGVPLAEWLENQFLLRGRDAGPTVSHDKVEHRFKVVHGFSMHIEPNKSFVGEFSCIPK